MVAGLLAQADPSMAAQAGTFAARQIRETMRRGLDDRTSPLQARQPAEQIRAGGGRARAIVYPRYGHQIPVQERDSVIDLLLKVC